MRRVKRLINCVFSDTVCNLDCVYCYIGQMNQHVKVSSKIEHSLAEIKKALSYKRLGGCCHMNLCANGETLLVDRIIEMAEMFILEGHIVSIVTNGLVTKKIEELCGLPEEIKKYLFLKVSFHYLELKTKGYLNTFWENVRAIKEAGISFTIELTVNDETLPFIEAVKNECMDHIGALCHVIESRDHDKRDWPRRTKMNIKEHQETWGQFQSPLFAFQQTIWGEKREEFCYAGDWICSIDIKSGDMSPCFGGGYVLDNIYADISRPLNFCAIGHKCPWGHCYAAYVLLTHGAIPAFTKITYAEERNRCGLDGKEWLRPSVFQAFSGKLDNVNTEYSRARKALTDFIMGIVYNDSVEISDVLVEAIRELFRKKGFYKIAVYGAGKLGKGLYELLLRCDLEVFCFMDRNYKQLVLPVKCVSNECCMAEVDLIIVSVYKHFSVIEKELRGYGNLSAIQNITHLLDEE